MPDRVRNRLIECACKTVSPGVPNAAQLRRIAARDVAANCPPKGNLPTAAPRIYQK
jgi:hypothetical protein